MVVDGVVSDRRIVVRIVLDRVAPPHPQEDEQPGTDLADALANVGAGVRYFTPIGPLRLDAAWQLTPTPDLFVEGQSRSRRWRFPVRYGIRGNRIPTGHGNTKNCSRH